jgi:hypothetical protein
MPDRAYILATLKSQKPKLENLGIKTVGLFGSYLREGNREQSDIDILIDFFPDKETFDNYMAVCDLFEQLFKNEKVDVVTKNGLSPYIGPKILNEVLYV